MLFDVALVALVGSLASLIGTGEKRKAKIVRRGISGFSLGFFGGHDLAMIINHYFTVSVSLGICVFFTSYVGAAFLDRVIVLINAFNIKQDWRNNDT